MRSRWMAAALIAAASSVAAAQVTRGEIDGVMNYARLDTSIACDGVIRPEAVVEIKRLGFKSIVNLRTANEPGANLEREASAARDAGIAYYNIPFDLKSPSPTLVDDFLETVAKPANMPAFIHCGSGRRSSALWMIKRVLVDGWDEPRAAAEAAQLGLTESPEKAFAVEYLRTHLRAK